MNVGGKWKHPLSTCLFCNANADKGCHHQPGFKFTIETEKPLNNANLILTNNLGNVVFQQDRISGQRISIDRGNLTSGIYYLRIVDGIKEYTGKVIISDK